MAAISAPVKVPFLWTVVQVESPKSQTTCPNPYLEPLKLKNIIHIHKIFLKFGYHFGSHEKLIGNMLIMSRDFEYYDIKIKKFGV